MIGFEVRGLRRAVLIASKEVGMVKGACCGGRAFFGGKGGREFGSGVDKTVRDLSRSGSNNLR
jgi:hypothetical protein